MRRSILLVDDEPQIARVLQLMLESSGYEVTVARDGMEALEKFTRSKPDLVITDLSMPVMDGIELTRTIRRQGDTPLIVLSVKDDEAMKVRALDEGADDYITKPFSIQELLARVRANLRRASELAQEPPSIVSIGHFYLDVEAHQVRRSGEPLHLTPKEFELLLLFVRNPGRVLTHKLLLHEIWGPAGRDQPEYLRVLVAQLRKKIETATDLRYIQNEPRVGYRFAPDAFADEDRTGSTLIDN